jgi:hypothetical protein
MDNETKGFLIELALFGGVLCPIAISVVGGSNSYFWRFFAWMIG